MTHREDHGVDDGEAIVTQNREPSVAIIYDKFLVRGGGERVCETLLDAFPNASLYALNARPRAFWEMRLKRPIKSPAFGGLFASRLLVSVLYPFAALAMATLRVKADVVIAYSSSCGKFASIRAPVAILYSNYPNRGIYQPEKVIPSRFLRTIIKPLLAAMAMAERKAIAKFGRRFSISQAAHDALQAFAGVRSEILMPPIDERGLSGALGDTNGAADTSDPYYVLISRLEPEKDLDNVIEAFSVSGRRLRVIGSGSQLGRLRARYGVSVTFDGFVEDELLASILAGARALVFPSEIEYSLVPLEAAYLGVPVVARDTPAMRELLKEPDRHGDGNAVFFKSGSHNDLFTALARMEKIAWDRAAIRRTAEGFTRPAFIRKIRHIVATSWNELPRP